MTDLERALAHCRDNEDYPDVMDKMSGVGYTFDYEGETYVTILREGQRRLYVNVKRFSNNPHYYGRIWWTDLYLRSLTDKNTETSIVGGSLASIKPREAQGGTIELVRELTGTDFVRDGGERWDGYEVGDMVPSFATYKDLQEVIDLVIKERFPGGWEIIHNY